MSRKFVYDNIPKVYFKRNRFSYNQEHLTTASVGDLFPFMCQEVYPGESYRLGTKVLSRTSSPFIKSPMVNLFMDIDYFFVPMRLVWDHWEEFLGDNKKGSWANEETYKVPEVSPPNWENLDSKKFSRTIVNRLGIMPYGSNEKVSALPLRAFALIYDSWYRDQNTQDPIMVQKGDSDDFININAFGADNYLGLIPKSNKFHDRFTSALPGPQKGISPSINFKLTADIPVSSLAKFAFDPTTTFVDGPGGITHTSFPGVIFDTMKFGFDNFSPQSDQNITLALSNNHSVGPSGNTDFSSSLMLGPRGVNGNSENIMPNNLWAIANNIDVNSGIDVNDLRYLFATQKLLERQARGGTRIKEILLNEWGVSSPDSRLQIPEYLGGKRNPLSHYQVPNTSGDTKSQAEISSFGHSMSSGRMSKSFVEHGYIIGVATIRQYHLYQQGVERYASRKNYYDFFNPVFSTIGEQPVYRRELYSMDTPTNNALGFGYQEAWSELRSRQNIVTGEMSSLIDTNLDVWQAGDDYSNSPILSSQFIEETPVFLDRCLSIPSTSQDQFILDFSTFFDSIKELPLYSVPSLIDHY